MSTFLGEDHTASCEDNPRWVENYPITISDSSGSEVVKILNGQDQRTNTYFKIVLTPSYVSIYSGETWPVKADPMHTIYLKRAN